MYSTSGTVRDPAAVLHHEPTTLTGTGSYVVLDFGKEVGGTLSVQIASTSATAQHLGIAFSEPSDYLNFSGLPTSDTSTGGSAKDGPSTSLSSPGRLTQRRLPCSAAASAT